MPSRMRRGLSRNGRRAAAGVPLRGGAGSVACWTSRSVVAMVLARSAWSVSVAKPLAFLAILAVLATPGAPEAPWLIAGR